MDSQRIHATCVALNGHSVLIIGDPGAGKSSLALGLISRGATLVSDDAVDLTREDEFILTTPPKTILGQIEARGFGILTLNYCESARLKFVIDMNKTEVRRLPEEKSKTLLGINFPLIFGGNNHHLVDAAFCVLKQA